MSKTNLKHPTSLSKVEVGFTIEIDSTGFCINCDVEDGDFEESMVPSLVLSYLRMLCRETGISFEKALRSSLGISSTLEAAAEA